MFTVNLMIPFLHLLSYKEPHSNRFLDVWILISEMKISQIKDTNLQEILMLLIHGHGLNVMGGILLVIHYRWCCGVMQPCKVKT